MKIFRLMIFVLMAATAPAAVNAQPPKLVVEIVLDQFPYDYIARFQPYFQEHGFNYFLLHGADFTNARYAYATTKTAPGHAAIATGCYSHYNGIVANRWWDRSSGHWVGSVDDDGVRDLGHSRYGHSPKNLLTFTAGDMLRIASDFRSKVISISHKDRSAILLGGKFGKAFWFEDSVVVTSSYYSSQLPPWVEGFNSSGKIQQFFGREWDELQPAVASLICDPGNQPYEEHDQNIGTTFPHHVTGGNQTKITGSYYHALATSPFATELLFDLAKEACTAESLGQRSVSDMLCIGISTTDDIGHPFGPQSHEVFDNALRTDAYLADFFAYLDKTIGLDQCLIVLTSDHGIAPIPEYLTKHNAAVPAGRIAPSRISAMVTAFLDATFGKPDSNQRWVDGVSESDVYINRALLASKHLQLDVVTRLLRDSLGFRPPFLGAFIRSELEAGSLSDRPGQLYLRAFYSSRSGDIVFPLRPYFIISGDSTGTNHGQPYDYDSHVPLLIAGKNIVQGTFPEEVSPVDIAPTIASILHAEFPPSREGRVLSEAIRYTTEAPYFQH